MARCGCGMQRRGTAWLSGVLVAPSPACPFTLAATTWQLLLGTRSAPLATLNPLHSAKTVSLIDNIMYCGPRAPGFEERRVLEGTFLVPLTPWFWYQSLLKRSAIPVYLPFKSKELTASPERVWQLYMWEYNKPGAIPVVILKTRRSLRAVHFRPHGVPYLLTAEVIPLPVIHTIAPLCYCFQCVCAVFHLGHAVMHFLARGHEECSGHAKGDALFLCC